MMWIGIIECLMESRSDQIRSDVVSEIEKRRSWWMVELWEGRVCQSTVSLDSLDSTRTQVACDIWVFFRADQKRCQLLFVGCHSKTREYQNSCSMTKIISLVIAHHPYPRLCQTVLSIDFISANSRWRWIQDPTDECGVSHRRRKKT